MIYQLIGAAVILITSADVYLTVLYPRTGNSVISLRLSKGMWELFRALSRLPFVGSDRVLSYCGPSLLVAIASFWVCLFTFGFALLIWPTLGSGIQASQGETPTGFATALYYSGFTLTTLGIGDLAPKTPLWRLVTVLEAAVGFSIFTATLTYLLSVYNALTRRNVFALSLYHRTGGKVNTADFLCRLKGNGKFEPAYQELSTISRDLIFLLESHHAYPILHYFRFQENYYALARIAFVSLDLATLVKTALHPQAYQAIINSSAVTELESSGLDTLHKLAGSFMEENILKGVSSISRQAWRQWYFIAIETLKKHGIETVTDTEAGADYYVAMREKWNAEVNAFAKYMGHTWDEIVPSSNQ